MQRTLSLDVYDYSGHALCNLYDSTNDIVGQAHNVYVHTERNGYKELRFSLPSDCDGERNYRLDFLVSDYRIRFREVKNKVEEIDWFLLSESKVMHSNFSTDYDIQASHISQLLNTKNLNLEFSDDEGNNTGTIGQIAATILEGTNWHLANVKKFYEEDKYNLQGKEKVRSFTAAVRTGAFKMMNDLCELFDAKPIYHGSGSYKGYIVKGTNPAGQTNMTYADELDYYAADRAAVTAESIGWTEITITEQGTFTDKRTVDILPMNPFSEKLDAGVIPPEVLEGEAVLGLYYDKNVKNIARTLNTDNLVTVFSAYGSYGDLNGIASLQNAEHAVLTFGSLGTKEYYFVYQNSVYYFKPTTNTNGLKWSYLDFQSRSYVYDGTHLYKVYKEAQTDNPELIEGTVEFVKNKVPYIMDFTYYDKVGLINDSMFRMIAENQTQVPAAHIAAEEASLALSEIKEELFKTASTSNGFLMLDIESSDIHNGYVRLTINKSKYMDGVIYRSDYDEARRNYFTWNVASGITSKGEAISGIGAVIYIVRQGNPTTWQKSYVKVYGNGTNNYYRDSLNNIYQLDTEQHYDRKEYSSYYPTASCFPSVGQPNIIYVDDSTTKIYIWQDNDYKEIKASKYTYGLNEFDHPDTITLWTSENIWRSGDKVYLFSADSIAGVFGPREDQIRSNKEAIEETTKVSTEVHPIYFVIDNQTPTEDQLDVCKKGYGWYYKSATGSYKFGDLFFCYGKDGDTSWQKVYVSNGDEDPEKTAYKDGYKYYYSLKRQMVYRKNGETYKAIKDTTDEKKVKESFSVVIDGCITQEILTKGMCERYNYSDTLTSLAAGGNYAFKNEFNNYWLFTTDRTISDPSLVYYDPSTKKVWQDKDEHHILSSVEHSFRYLEFPKNNELSDTTFTKGTYDNGEITYEGNKQISNNIYVHDKVSYTYFLPSGSIVACYDENGRFLAQFTSSPFTAPAYTNHVQLICNSVPTSSHYFRLTDYNKALFCKNVKYTILSCTGAGTRTGMNYLMDEFIRLAHEAYEVKLVDLRQAQQNITDMTNNLSKALGDMYREGWWQETKYVGGDEDKLYSDALENLKEISHPQATYEISYLDLYGSDDNLGAEVKTKWSDVDISYAAHLVDTDIDTNCWAYIDKIEKCYDQPWKTQIEVNTRLSMIGQQSFTDVLAKIAEVANQVKAKQAIYDNAQYIGSAGQLAAEKLEGLIQANKLYILGGTSNWYTDSKGNIVFEDTDGNSAMMLTGRGLLIANQKDEYGEWLWRTALSGKGFNCDVIATGEFSAKHILAGTITTDKLSSMVGQELEIGSNKALTLYATADGMRPAGSLLTRHPAETDSWIAIGAKDDNNPAYIDIQSGGIVNIYSGSKMNIESEGKLEIKAGSEFLVNSPNFKIEKNGSSYDVTVKGNITTTGGKIAGFTIGSATGRDYMYSGTKKSMSTAGEGIYIGTDGINIADKFKFSADGNTAALSVNASDITLGDITGFTTLSGKLGDMDTKTSTAQSTADAAKTTATNLANGTISVPLVDITGIHIYEDGSGSNKKGHIDIAATGSINMAANSSLTIMSNSSNSAVILNKDGISIGSGANISIVAGGTVTIGAADNSFIIGATTGTNAHAYITSDKDRTAYNTANANTPTKCVYIGTDGISLGTKSTTTDGTTTYSIPFKVDASGNLNATSATITGTVTATDGRIGNWYIKSNSLCNASTLANSTVGMYPSSTSTDVVFWAGNKTRGSANFRVYANGDVTLNAVTAKGTIKATSLYVGATSSSDGTQLKVLNGFAVSNSTTDVGSAIKTQAGIKVDSSGVVISSSSTAASAVKSAAGITVNSTTGVVMSSASGDSAAATATLNKIAAIVLDGKKIDPSSLTTAANNAITKASNISVTDGRINLSSLSTSVVNTSNVDSYVNSNATVTKMAGISVTGGRIDLTSLSSSVVNSSGLATTLANYAKVEIVPTKISALTFDTFGNSSKVQISPTKVSVGSSGSIDISGTGSINLTGGSINLNGGAFTVQSGNFSIDTSGNVKVKGEITATSGSIAGWEIRETSLGKNYSSGSYIHNIEMGKQNNYVGYWMGSENASNAPLGMVMNTTNGLSYNDAYSLTAPAYYWAWWNNSRWIYYRFNLDKMWNDGYIYNS